MEWLHAEHSRDLATLPSLVNLPEAPPRARERQRSGPADDGVRQLPATPKGVTPKGDVRTTPPSTRDLWEVMIRLRIVPPLDKMGHMSQGRELTELCALLVAWSPVFLHLSYPYSNLSQQGFERLVREAQANVSGETPYATQQTPADLNMLVERMRWLEAHLQAVDGGLRDSLAEPVRGIIRVLTLLMEDWWEVQTDANRHFIGEPGSRVFHRRSGALACLHDLELTASELRKFVGGTVRPDGRVD